MAIPKLPGLPTAPASLQGWISGAQDVLRALREFAEKTDFFNALRVAGMEVQKTKPVDGEVLTVAGGASKAIWTTPAPGYTDEQAQDAVGNIAGPTTGPVRLDYDDATPSLTVEVDIMEGDSGSGGAEGLVPAQAAGDAAAGKYLKADGTWDVPPGSGGSTASIWIPELPPASPHTMDDYFEAGSLDAKWTDYDFGAFITNSISTTRSSFLMTAGTPSGSTQLAGIYQPVPGTSEYACYAKVWVVATPGSSVNPGIILLEDGASSSGDARIFYSRLPGGGGAGSLSASAYNSPTGAADLTATGRPTFIRLRVSGTNFAADFSEDGKHWGCGSMAAISFTPQHVGVGANIATGPGSIAGFEFFKVFSGTGTSGEDATHLGGIAGVVI